MEKLIYSLGIIFFGLTLGYVIQVLIHKKIISIPCDIHTLRKTFQKFAQLFFNPIAFMGAFWIVKIDDLKYIAIPFIGAAAFIFGGLIAYIFAMKLKMNRKQTGTYIVSGGFTNIGSIGGLICFMLLGEAGFAMMSLYKLLEPVVYFGIGYPIANAYSLEVSEVESFKKRIKKLLLDPFMLVAVVSMLIGFALNFSGLKRPDFYITINTIFVPVGTILLLSSIGMAMRFDRIGGYIKEGLLIALIKFIIVPVMAVTIAYILGLGTLDQGLPLKVVMILSSMPVAFAAMVPPTIYDLDVDLANANWLVTTMLLVLVIPALQYLTTHF